MFFLYVFVFFTVVASFWLQEVHSQLCSQKVQFQCIMDRLKMKYCDTAAPAPSETEAQLQEVAQSLQRLEQKVTRVRPFELPLASEQLRRENKPPVRSSNQVAEAVESGGPIYSLGAKLSEIQTGLNSVQKRLDERSPTVTQAKVTQKVSEGVTDHLDLEETSHRHIVTSS